MSWNRLSHDPCAYKADLFESVKPLSYHLDPVKYYRCDACRNELGLVGGNNVSQIQGNLVDLENDLLRINRPLTHCSSFKHQPSDERFIQRKEYMKPVVHEPIDTAKTHLRPCQMIHYKQVPLPPPVERSVCAPPSKTTKYNM